MANADATAEPEEGVRAPRFLRRRGALTAALAVPFVGSVAGALVLALIYHWPHVSVPTYYFIVRPPFVWFGAIGPFMAFGLAAVRWRWFAAGCALWLAAFLATQEVLPCLKPFGGRARDRFQAAQARFEGDPAVAASPAGGGLLPLRLVTWNVGRGQPGFAQGVRQLGALHPDVVLMQEFGPGHIGWMTQDVEESPLFEGYTLEGMDLAILSRWPVQELKDDVLPQRVARAWRVEVAPGVPVVFVDVHLSPQPLRTQLLRGWSWSGLEDAIVRTRWELKTLGEAVAFYARQGPVVLAGDFNVPPRYPDLRHALDGFVDCFGAAGHGWGKTVPAKLPVLRVDQIHVPPGSRVYYATAVVTRWSDHYMTFAEAAIPVSGHRTGVGE